MAEKKYKSCTAEMGKYCSKHGVIHKKEVVMIGDLGVGIQHKET